MIKVELKNGNILELESLKKSEIDQPIKSITYNLSNKKAIKLSGFDAYIFFKDTSTSLNCNKTIISNHTFLCKRGNEIYQITQHLKSKQIVQSMNKIEKPYIRFDYTRKGWKQSVPFEINNQLWVDGEKGISKTEMINL